MHSRPRSDAGYQMEGFYMRRATALPFFCLCPFVVLHSSPVPSIDAPWPRAKWNIPSLDMHTYDMMDTRAGVANLKALSGVPRNLNQIATGNCGRRLVRDIQPNLVGYLSFNIYGEACCNVGTISKYKYTKIPEITTCNTWILQERERERARKKKHETSRYLLHCLCWYVYQFTSTL